MLTNYDNKYNGIGAPWNVTHWANRTDYNKEISFTNGSYDSVEIPLGTGWNGYKLNATINELYDTRNWCNGTFNYGMMDSIDTPGNDTELIENNFQNWSYFSNDIGSNTNAMSGNYLNSSSVDSEGQDCLELRIDGEWGGILNDVHYYDGGDKCWWNSSFKIPRGRVSDSELQFEVRDYHLIDINMFELRFYLNYLKDKIHIRGLK